MVTYPTIYVEVVGGLSLQPQHSRIVDHKIKALSNNENPYESVVEEVAFERSHLIARVEDAISVSIIVQVNP